jgi:hypothetical protein
MALTAKRAVMPLENPLETGFQTSSETGFRLPPLFYGLTRMTLSLGEGGILCQ